MDHWFWLISCEFKLLVHFKSSIISWDDQRLKSWSEKRLKKIISELFNKIVEFKAFLYLFKNIELRELFNFKFSFNIDKLGVDEFKVKKFLKKKLESNSFVFKFILLKWKLFLLFL